MSAAEAGKPRSIGRRVLLVGAAVGGGGLAIGVGFVAKRLSDAQDFRLPAGPGEASFGAWLTIDRAGVVTVAVPHVEMGQGVWSSLPMLVADELDVDPSKVRAVQSPVHAAYANPVAVLDGLPFRPDDDGPVASGARWTMERILRAVGLQLTGGSTSMRNTWVALREAGASARAMLLAVAAERLGVKAADLRISAGVVSHPGLGRSIPIGELAAAAAAREPVRGTPKSADRWRLIGRGMPRLDVPSKVDGSAMFGIDVRLPGLVYAAVRHAPTIGGRLLKASAPPAPPAGFLQLVTGPDWYAVVAASWWQAHTALDKVAAEWDEGPNAALSTEAVFERYREALDGGRAKVQDSRGDAKAQLGDASKRVKAEYRAPFLAHAPMEPPNCTALVQDGRCRVWVGTQVPTLAKWVAAQAAGVPFDHVDLEVPFLGGGFGRRLETDFVRQGVEIARAVPGRPVQTIWSREEDLRRDMYRPAALARFEAAVAPKRGIAALQAAIASPSIGAQFAQRIGGAGGMPDKTNTEGAVWLPYDLGALEVSHAQVEVPVPVGYWRSVGHSFNAFFVESFVDECAAAAGEDPYLFRRALLQANPRARKVLDAAAQAAGWGQPIPVRPGARRARGIALAESFRSIVAEVVEVEVSADGAIRVPRVFAAVDCGLAVDPPNVRAQLASAIVFGLSAALHGRIDIENGRVRQSNFHDYPALRLADSPRIQVQIVESGAELGGIGEVGTPPVAPALANAVFAATGRRLRELPLKLG